MVFGLLNRQKFCEQIYEAISCQHLPNEFINVFGTRDCPVRSIYYDKGPQLWLECLNLYNSDC